jgi:putative DNA primase/helicase
MTKPSYTSLAELERLQGLADASVRPMATSMQPAGDERPEPDEPEPAEERAARVWPDPVIPGNRSVPDIPAKLLPGWLGDYAAAVATSSQTPEAMSVMLCLSVLSTVFQHWFVVAPFGDDYTEPLPLWTCSIMPPGSRKTAVVNAMTGVFAYWEKLRRDRMRSEVAKNKSQRELAKKRIEKLLADAAKAKDEQERNALRAEAQREEEGTPEEVRAPRLFTSNTTPEQMQTLLTLYGECMSVISDEPDVLQVVLGMYSGKPSLDVFLQGHACSPLRVDRASRSAHIDKPCISFGLAVQNDMLKDVAGDRRLRGSGFLARMLWVMPASNVGQRDVRSRVPIPEAVRKVYDSRVMALLDARPDMPMKPKVLALTEAAREMWLDFAEQVERRQGPGGDLESVVDWTSKLPGAVARIAAVLDLATTGPNAEQVNGDCMAVAVEIGALLIKHALAVFGFIGTDGTDVDARAMLDWVRSKGLAEVRQRDLHAGMQGRFPTLERLTKAADRLIQNGVSLREVRRERGKRPSTVYVFNPQCLSPM